MPTKCLTLTKLDNIKIPKPIVHPSLTVSLDTFVPI